MQSGGWRRVGASGAMAYEPAVNSVTQDHMAPGNKTTRRDADDGPPSSPTDGDIWIAEDVGGENSGVAWTFVYNADSSSARKWEYIGGPSLRHVVGAAENHPGPNGTWQNLATDGPELTVPFSGDYEVKIQSRTAKTKGEAQAIYFGVAVGDVNPSFVVYWQDDFTGTTAVTTGCQEFAWVGLAAGANLKMRYFGGNNSGTTPWGQFFNRQLSIRPIRVS